MTRCTTRLGFGTAQQRGLPQMKFAVGLFFTVDGDALAFMAAGATEFFPVDERYRPRETSRRGCVLKGWASFSKPGRLIARWQV